MSGLRTIALLVLFTFDSAPDVGLRDGLQFDLDFGNDGQSEEEAPRLYMITLDLESGQASRRCISPAMGEFPTIHPRLTGAAPTHSSSISPDTHPG